MLATSDDRIVAGRAADGDVTAFAVLVRRYGPMMRATARRILGSSSDVDDVVQEAFITAWNKLDQLDDPRRVKAWLMRITSHRAIDRVRAHRHTDDATELDVPTAESDSPSHITQAKATVAALRAALAQLPEAQRRCWVLREAEQMSYREIAEALELPESTVRGLLARARKSIMARMEVWQ
ncbi:RNA polymerase sigma factor [Arachnia propionica]|uniref:RNA polymerase sigma factor n=1 Tax=Arachnia propionica TaxID=1750 RepID=A0A3P1TD91_9ACTN|nr:RNA polymerase sigma factor [Arachnia propionica]